MDNILTWLIKETTFEKQIIFDRAEIIYKHILHHYSDFSVSTIDKFTFVAAKLRVAL